MKTQKMKKGLGTLLVGDGLATALAPQVAISNQSHTVVERQVINDMKQVTKSRKTITDHIGGIPIVTEYGKTPGLSPKEYGLRFGNGNSRNKKINKLQRSHLYKVSKR